MSSLLKMGLTSANLNGVGKIFIAIQVFIRLHIDTDSSLYAILIIFPGILSYPVAFLGLIFLMFWITKSTVTGLKSNSPLISPNSWWICYYPGMLFVFTYGISSRNNGVIKTNAGSHSREKLIKNFHHLRWIINDCIFSFNVLECDLVLWPWPCIFKVKFWKDHITRMRVPIDMETMLFDRKSHPLCDFELWHHSWP